MTTIQDRDIPAAQQGEAQTWVTIAVGFASDIAGPHFQRGDLADLRRMDPDFPNAAAFWRLMARQNLLGSLAIERKWSLILHGIALMTNTSNGISAHNGAMPVGRALFLGGDPQRPTGFYSETRLNRLLTARGPMLRTLLARMFRMMGTARQPFNWREMARLILNDGYNEDRAEDVRRKIARAYYEAERRSSQSSP